MGSSLIEKLLNLVTYHFTCLYLHLVFVNVRGTSLGSIQCPDSLAAFKHVFKKQKNSQSVFCLFSKELPQNYTEDHLS